MRQRSSLLGALIAGLLLASACGETTVSTATGPVGDAVVVAPVAPSTAKPATATPPAPGAAAEEPEPEIATGTNAGFALCSDLPRYGATVPGNLAPFANPDDSVMELANRYGNSITDRFGGLFIDRDNGGALVFLVTDDPQPHIDELTQILPATAGSLTDEGEGQAIDVAFEVLQVAHSQRELQSQIQGLMTVLAPGRISSGGVDVFTNRIFLDLLDPEEDDLLRLAEEVDPSQFCVSISRTPPRPEGPLNLIDDPTDTGPRELPANMASVRIELVAPTGPDTTILDLSVTEVSCASGQPMGDRLLGAELVETDTTVLIAFATLPRMGGQNCQGNAPVITQVTLAAPVGDRAIFDAVTGERLG